MADAPGRPEGLHYPDDTTGTPRWREDFPIRWDRDHYMTRRELAKFLTLGSGLIAATNLLIAAIGLARTPEATPEARVAGAADLAPGSALLFRYPTAEDPCILVREASGEFHAYSQVCTHLSCAVVYRPAGRRLDCPCHRGAFSSLDGRVLAGPPTRPLPRITLERRGDELFATGIEIAAGAL